MNLGEFFQQKYVIVFFNYFCFLYCWECVNVEEKIMEIAQKEAYIICNSNQFHVVVDGLYMYSIDT